MAKNRTLKEPLTRLMSTKYIFGIAAALLILIVVIYLRNYSDKVFPLPIGTTTTISTPPTTTTTTTTLPPTEKSTLAVSIDHEGNKLNGGAEVHNLIFRIESIAVHSLDNDKWIELPISEEHTRPDLMKYPPRASFAQREVDSGDYDKMKIELGDGNIWITNDIFYIFSPKPYDLKPTKEIDIDYSFTLEPDNTKTLSLTLDIKNSITRVGTYYLMEPRFSVGLIDGVVGA